MIAGFSPCGTNPDVSATILAFSRSLPVRISQFFRAQVSNSAHGRTPASSNAPIDFHMADLVIVAQVMSQ
jgi:hypothetical protein